MENKDNLHSPKIARMLNDLPRPLVAAGWAVVIGLLVAFILALLLIPSPYDAGGSIGRHIVSALF